MNTKKFLVTERAVWVPALVFVLSAALLLTLYGYMRSRQFQERRQEVEITGEQCAIRLQEYVELRLSVVTQMRELWDRGLISEEQSFEEHALAILEQFSGLQAINYVDNQGVIRWVVPEQNNRGAKGKDLHQHSGAASTFIEAERTQQMQLTPPLDLLQGGRGMAAYIPLIEQGGNRGYLNAVFRLNYMVEDCFSRDLLELYEIAIFDDDALVYSSLAEPQQVLVGPLSDGQQLRVAGRTWQFYLVPQRQAALPSPRIGLIGLIAALLISATLAVLVRLLILREDAVRQSEQRYRAIFETTGTATIIYDEHGSITLANAMFAALVGRQRDRIEQHAAWTEFFAPESRERLRAHDQRRDPAPATFEAQLIDSEGRRRDGILTVNLIPGTTKRVASFLDITDRKRAEQQMFRSEKMAALGQIIAGVAHEINNPNNFIFFNLPILRRYLDSMLPLLDRCAAQEPGLKILNMPYEAFVQDISKLLDNMQHGSERITNIVAELKNYIRGHEAEELKPENLLTLVDQVMTLVGKQVRKMVKRLDLELAPDLPLVKLNLGKIEQVLINLLINAGQAADKADSWVRLSAGLTPGRPGWVSIKVADNGCGIPAELLDRIFDPFFTTKGRESGTGLGLSISQRIVEEHGGRISVASTAGQGSCFEVLLPIGGA